MSTQLYLNTSQDYLMLNASDWLILDSVGVTPLIPATYPTTPNYQSATISSYSPSFVSVTHGLARQSRSRGAHAWQIDLTYPGMTRATFATLWSFLNKQAGRAGTFYWAPGAAFAIRGAGGGTPKVLGGGQVGTSLNTEGWPNSTVVLKAGDFFQIENDAKVYQVTEDCTSNGSGQATIKLFPSLRISPPAAWLISTSVTFKCALVSDTMPVDWTHCVHVVGFSVSLMEVP